VPEYDHIASECPNRIVVTIVEDVIKEYEEEVNQEQRETEEIIEYVDEGEALVI